MSDSRQVLEERLKASGKTTASHLGWTMQNAYRSLLPEQALCQAIYNVLCLHALILGGLDEADEIVATIENSVLEVSAAVQRIEDFWRSYRSLQADPLSDSGLPARVERLIKDMKERVDEFNNIFFGILDK